MSKLPHEDWAAKRRAVTQSLPDQLAGAASLPAVLLPYQQDLLLATAAHQLVVTDKSRRVGATWGVGADAVLTSAAQRSAGGMDTLYIGYNFDMAREFVDCCAMWAKAFAPAASAVEEWLFEEEGERGERNAIAAFRIRFASGFEIVALSSKPRSLRGRQGYVIIDEFAFHDAPAELLKAALALLIWGGKVLVISTHNGVDNPFNELIQEIREKRRPGAVVRVTFDDALAQGLYQRICLVRGRPWSPEAEATWAAGIRAMYGEGAAEELDCVPSQGSGVWLTRALIEANMDPGLPVVRLTCPAGFELQGDAVRKSFVDAWLEEHVAPLLAALDPHRAHAYGFDFARSGDLSVLVPVEEEQDLGLLVPFVLEMRNVPFRQQEQVVFYVGDRLPRFVAARHDARGNGQFLAEYAVQKYGATRVEAVMTSQSWYLEHMPPLKATIEDIGLRMPMDADLMADLRLVTVVRGIPMVPEVKTKGADGAKRHGDFAIALALAHAAIRGEWSEYDYQSASTQQADGGPDDDDADDDPWWRTPLGAGLRGGL